LLKLQCEALLLEPAAQCDKECKTQSSCAVARNEVAWRSGLPAVWLRSLLRCWQCWALDIAAPPSRGGGQGRGASGPSRGGGPGRGGPGRGGPGRGPPGRGGGRWAKRLAHPGSLLVPQNQTHVFSLASAASEDVEKGRLSASSDALQLQSSCGVPCPSGLPVLSHVWAACSVRGQFCPGLLPLACQAGLLAAPCAGREAERRAERRQHACLAVGAPASVRCTTESAQEMCTAQFAVPHCAMNCARQGRRADAGRRVVPRHRHGPAAAGAAARWPGAVAAAARVGRSVGPAGAAAL
jgi:hypothetical protein